MFAFVLTRSIQTNSLLIHCSVTEIQILERPPRQIRVLYLMRVAFVLRSIEVYLLVFRFVSPFYQPFCTCSQHTHLTYLPHHTSHILIFLTLFMITHFLTFVFTWCEICHVFFLVVLRHPILLHFFDFVVTFFSVMHCILFFFVKQVILLWSLRDHCVITIHHTIKSIKFDVVLFRSAFQCMCTHFHHLPPLFWGGDLLSVFYINTVMLHFSLTHTHTPKTKSWIVHMSCFQPDRRPPPAYWMNVHLLQVSAKSCMWFSCQVIIWAKQTHVALHQFFIPDTRHNVDTTYIVAHTTLTCIIHPLDTTPPTFAIPLCWTSNRYASCMQVCGDDAISSSVCISLCSVRGLPSFVHLLATSHAVFEQRTTDFFPRFHSCYSNVHDTT